MVPCEVFHKPLGKGAEALDGANGGRPPHDPVMMFKIMVLQALYGLSDHQAEFQIQDRLSFMRFLGWVSETGCRPPRRSGRSGSISHRPAR
ncbi:transposase [Mesorhizobium sp. M0239]|uniref:transposase n=1 Tax=Mesorhizobium sp. M0239 TaxID=2956924 RepID=UPI00333DD3DA